MPYFKMIVIFTMFGIYAYFTPDFLGHLEIIDYIEYHNVDEHHFELVYLLLLNLVKYDNILFRAIIMIIMFGFLYFIGKRFSYNPSLFLFCFAIMALFSYANVIRSSLSDCVIYSGIFIFYWKQNIKTFIILLVFSILSVFFHKSVIMISIPLLLSIIITQKIYIKYSIILFPIIVISAKFITSWIFRTYFISSEEYMVEIDHALSKVLRNYIYNFILICTWGFILLKLYNHADRIDFIGYIYRFLFYSFIIYLSFFFMGYSNYVGDRFGSHCILPLTIAITWCKQLLKRNTQIKIMLLMLIFLLTDYLGAFVSLREYIIHNTSISI